MAGQQKVISSTFNVSTVDETVSLQAQYAPNHNPTSSQIHNTWQDGDLYMRTKMTNENTWSDWHKIVGENGGETDFSFAISSKATSTNSSTPPSDCTSESSWHDAPQAVTEQKPYLWSRVQQKSWNESTQSYVVDSTRYIRLTGEGGEEYIIESSQGSVTIGENQTTGTLSNVTLSFFKKEGGKEREAYSCFCTIFQKKGSTYTAIKKYTTAGAAVTYTHTSGTGVPALTAANYDAIVVCIYNAASNSHSGYLAELEIPVRKNGDSAFTVDLNNEMTNVALEESSGELISDADIYFEVRAFIGTTSVIQNCTVTPTSSDPDMTVSYNSTTHKVRVEISAGTQLEDTTTITITVAHSSYGTRVLHAIIAGVKGGKNAILQEILPSLNEISFARQDDGTLSPASRSLSLSFKKTEGGEITIQTLSDSGLTVRWSDSAMPTTASSGNNWGNETPTGISWDNITMNIANNVSASNIYIAAFKLVGENTYVLVDRETIPILKDGKHGSNAPYVELSRQSILYDANSSGASSSSQDFAITYALKAKGTTLTIAQVSDISITLPTGVTVKSNTKTTSGVTFNIDSSATPSGVIIITMTGTDANGISYTASSSITVGANKKGDSAVMYKINTSIDNVVIPSDVDSTTLSSVTASFIKITGNTEARQSMYWGYCWRDGTSYGTIMSGQPSDSINLPQTYSSSHDALVIFVRTSGSVSTTNFDAKKEIIIQKRGNTGNSGKDARYIHIKGTGQNNNQSALCEVYNGDSLDSRTVTSRGLTIYKINRSTLAITLVGNYDVYGDSVLSGEAACHNFAQKLDAITSDYFVCIVSYDAVRWTSEMIQTLTKFGSLGVNDTTAYCVPFAFIGQKGLAQGQAMQVQGGSGTTDPPAEIVVYVSNGVMATSKESTVGKLGGRFYYNAGVFDYSSSVSYYVNAKEAPYFLYNNDYWVFEPNETSETNVYYTTQQMNYPSSKNSNWHLMFYNKQRFFMSDVMFAKYAHLGSFMFNGDWQLSTNGRVNNVDYNNGASIGGDIRFGTIGEQFSVKAYTLFNPKHPTGDDEIISQTSSTVIIGNQETEKTIATFTLRAGVVYHIIYGGRRYSSSFSVYIRLKKDSSHIWSLGSFTSTSNTNGQTAAFMVKETGSYTLQLYQPIPPSSSSTTAGGECSMWQVGELNFEPTYAVDGLAGSVIQHDGLFTGFIKKRKVTITTSNMSKYVKKTPFGNQLLFDRCGTWVEIGSGVQVDLSLPLMCHYITTNYANKITESSKDDIRSYIGSKIIIYNKSGSTISVTRAQTETSTYGTQIVNGNCSGFECVLDKEIVNGIAYEVVKWVETSGGSIL